VEPWYHRADAVVAPLRAGSGTRIKILEAMSYRRPVVSTPAGIEGLAARDGEHLLVGDTAEAFACQCVRLMEVPSLGERLSRDAFDLCVARYTSTAVAAALDEALAS
jgi:glycosyltransferase involved in cell wall biosynthesis